MNIKNLRKEYTLKKLDKSDVDKNPYLQFNNWFSEALDANVLEPSAMIVSTVNKNNQPSARVLLLKEVTEKGFVFFSNYNSSKAVDLEINNNACITFFWPELERQVRIEGTVTKVSEDESIKYFNSRPEGSKIGAWASEQSTIVASRMDLEDKYEFYLEKYKDLPIPKPDFWGGYILDASKIEFWQGRSSRLHDRIVYEKTKENWNIFRLAP